VRALRHTVYVHVHLCGWCGNFRIVVVFLESYQADPVNCNQLSDATDCQIQLTLESRHTYDLTKKLYHYIYIYLHPWIQIET